MFSCVRCRRTIADSKESGFCPFCRPAAIRRSINYRICETNRCGHFVLCPKTNNWGCELHPRRPCGLDKHLIDGGGCFNDPPLFLPESKLLNQPINEITFDFTDTPINRSSDKAIVVFCIGNKAKELSKFTMPQIEQYAEKCGADLVVVTDNQCKQWPIGNKLRFGQIASHYSRSLLLDIDVFVADHAEDIFATYSSGVWMHDDLIYAHRWSVALLNELAYLSNHYSLPRTRHAVVYNTGVLLLDQQHAESWRLPPSPLHLSHTAEQSWIHLMLADQWDIQGMDSMWNWCWFGPNFKQRMFEASFVHLAAAPHSERLEILDKLQSNVVLH